jgi:hypothetical protein
MGLFFDQDWFDAKLKSAGLTRASMAQAAGMTIDEVEMVFADRRELEGREVSAIARVLRVDPQEVATRSGAAEIGGENSFDRSEMNVPIRPIREGGEFQVTREVINGIHERMDRLERMLEMVLTKLDRR